MKKILLTVLSTLGVSTAAQAGFLVEPFLGYETGTTSCTTLADADCGSKSTAIALGSRFGYKLSNGLWFAGEYGTTTSGKTVADADDSESDITRTTTGVVVGYDWSEGFRLYFGYNLSQNIKLVDEDDSETTFTGGSSYKLGLGWGFKNNIAVNFEYGSSSPAEYETDLGDGDVADVFDPFSTTAMTLNVSFPFNFGK